MNDEKAWYRSKTIWGGIVAFVAAVSGLFGIYIDEASGQALAVALTDAVAAIGAVVAIVGRLDAETTIS